MCKPAGAIPAQAAPAFALPASGKSHVVAVFGMDHCDRPARVQAAPEMPKGANLVGMQHVGLDPHEQLPGAARCRSPVTFRLEAMDLGSQDFGGFGKQAALVDAHHTAPVAVLVAGPDQVEHQALKSARLHRQDAVHDMKAAGRRLLLR